VIVEVSLECCGFCGRTVGSDMVRFDDRNGGVDQDHMPNNAHEVDL
jgi:hypothetical protein